MRILLVLAVCCFCQLSMAEGLQRIAFGSCSHQDKPQPIWLEVLASDPDLFIFLGDNIYGDSEDPQVLASKYQRLLAVEGVQTLLDSTEVIATWDDHDYGINNGDASFALKNKSKELYLDFLEEPKNSARRSQQGVYASYTSGVSGEMVKFILLDNRFAATRGPTSADRDDMLGPEQWAWLENELATNTAQLTFIGSGVQIVS